MGLAPKGPIVKNKDGKKYFVNAQLPPSLNEDERRKRQMIVENNKRSGAKANMQLSKGQLLINNELYRKKVVPPTTFRMLTLNKQERDLVDNVKIIKTNTITEKGSSFQAVVTEVSSLR